MFEIGQKVKLVDNFDTVKSAVGLGIVDNMYNYLNKELTISEFNAYNDSYNILEDNSEFSWGSDMFIPIETGCKCGGKCNNTLSFKDGIEALYWASRNELLCSITDKMYFTIEDLIGEEDIEDIGIDYILDIAEKAKKVQDFYKTL